MDAIHVADLARGLTDLSISPATASTGNKNQPVRRMSFIVEGQCEDHRSDGGGSRFRQRRGPGRG